MYYKNSMTDFLSTTYRQQFPALRDKTYFNYGGQGPLPKMAGAAIQSSYEYVQKFGPFSQHINAWVNQEASQTRELIAQELQVSPTTISLTEDVTVGCNIVLWGIDWQPGDHILLSDCEHPGVIAVIQELQRRFHLEVSTCPLLATLNGGDPTAVISQYLRSNTKVLVISHIVWNTGQLLPLGDIVELCHQKYEANGHKIRVLVDAAQSVGVLPLNLTELGVDFYAFTGHKWWCGPEGLGGLYVSPNNLDFLHPTFIGWRSILADANGQPTGFKPDGRKYEIATSAYPLYAGLRAGITLHHQWGTAEQRYQKILELSAVLWQQLSELPQITCLRTQPPESGLISFTVAPTSSLTSPEQHRKLVDFLEKQNIFVRLIMSPNCVRVCVHYFTELSEIDQLIQAVSQFLTVRI